MWKFRLWIAASVCALSLASATARAACQEDFRRVELSSDNIVRLRSFLCRTNNQSAPLIQVEFHRLSDVVASLILSKQHSAMVERTIGSPRVIENDVFRAYTELLQRFGTTRDVPIRANNTYTTFELVAAGKGGTAKLDDELSGLKMRTIVNPFTVSFAYPAANEIAELQRRIIGQDVRFFYKSSYGNTTTMLFWRGMRPSDLTNYSRNAAAYSRNVRADSGLTNLVPSNLKLVGHVARERWPDDFLILAGQYFPENATCEGLPGWEFNYWMRGIILEVILIENVSNEPIQIKGLFGDRSPDKGLRVAPATRAKLNGGESLGPLSEILQRGEKLLVPIKITFVPTNDLREIFKDRNASGDMYRRLGASGFGGNVAGHAAPVFKNYNYGPELNVSSIAVDETRINLGTPSANFMDMTASSEIGSCPHLLSWNGGDDWIEHGKVLHLAKGRQLEYSETRIFSGFHQRFRIEEREPEVSYIDRAELIVRLKNGATLALAPDNAHLVAHDGDYVRLPWGKAVEFGFALPDGMVDSDVTESRLSLTGYYERYSNSGSLRSAASALRTATSRNLLGTLCLAPDSRRSSADQP